MGFRTPYYEGWEETIIWQLEDLFRANIGAPKVLNAHQTLSRYPPVPIVYATPLVQQSRDLVDWNGVRPALTQLFEQYGDVFFEFGGHDEFRNVWFHAFRVYPQVYEGDRLKRFLKGILFVRGTEQFRAKL